MKRLCVDSDGTAAELHAQEEYLESRLGKDVMTQRCLVFSLSPSKNMSDYMELNPSWEAVSRSDTQEYPNF
jgi:hypothetical protein